MNTLKAHNLNDQFPTYFHIYIYIYEFVYKAEVTTTDNAETNKYIGISSNEFKVRYRNHKKSFRDEKHSNETELSKYIWDLKKSRRNFSLKWSILKRATTVYQTGANQCNLCLEEMLYMHLKSEK